MRRFVYARIVPDVSKRSYFASSKRWVLVAQIKRVASQNEFIVVICYREMNDLLYLVPSLRVQGATPQLLHTPLCRGA